MSRRQPKSSKATAPIDMTVRVRTSERARRAQRRAWARMLSSSVLNFKYSMRMQAFQELFCFDEIEFLVPRFDTQEETVGRSQRESLDIKRRVIRGRQSVEREHSKYGREGCAQDRQLESNRYPHRPAIERFPTDIQREADHVGVPAHAETGQPSAQAPKEDQRRKNRPVKSHGLGQALDRDGRKRVNATVAGVVRLMSRRQHFFRRLKLSHQTVNALLDHTLAVNLRIRIADARKIGGARPCVQILKQTVIARLRLELGYLAVGIVDIPEHDRFGRAGALARCDDLAVADQAILFLGPDLCRIDSLHAVGALLHDS